MKAHDRAASLQRQVRGIYRCVRHKLNQQIGTHCESHKQVNGSRHRTPTSWVGSCSIIRVVALLPPYATRFTQHSSHARTSHGPHSLACTQANGPLSVRAGDSSRTHTATVHMCAVQRSRNTRGLWRVARTRLQAITCATRSGSPHGTCVLICQSGHRCDIDALAKRPHTIKRGLSTSLHAYAGFTGINPIASQ